MSTFSVVIPTYQRPGELAQCLDRLKPGVQDISFEEYEVIVTDDEGTGSDTQRLVRERYPWATWAEGPGRGAAANRNAGATRAASEWLVFTDDDCLPDPRWLAAFRDVQRKASPDIMEGKTIADGKKPGPGWTAPVNLDGSRLWSCNFAVRRSLFENLGGFDEKYLTAGVEDVDFRVRALKATNSHQFIPEAIVVHPWRKSRSFWAQLKKVRSWRRFYRKFPERTNPYNANYHLGSLIGALKWLPLAIWNENWRLEAGGKVTRLLKTATILYEKARNDYKQQS